MDKKLIESAAREFAYSGKLIDTVDIRVGTTSVEYVQVTFERKKMIPTNESFNKSINANTISAFPSGEKCGACGGSGRA
ncbi:hypothetical protein [Janthinobacterium sp. AD80]|uniref:hypothetical protein n=1 Tax=Janthinobacterium sp. AD80 TaxID=1528773 RepID=UPI0011AFA499|nr:hypothetical protein [Janthinobacterium sp. AD80]